MGGGRWRRELVRAAAVVALINLGGWLVADGASRWTLRLVAAEGWPVEGGALANVEALFPDNPENDAALALERVAAAAGINLAPRGDDVSSARRPSAEAARRLDAAKTTFADYAKGETLAPPPARLAAFLSAAAGPLADAERLLETGERPRWVRRASAGFEMPLPPLLGHIQLTRALIARAKEAGLRGDDDAAWRSLRAAARLADSLGERPERLSQLIRIAETRDVVTTMRVLPRPAPEWAWAWMSTDLRPGVVRAHLVDAAMLWTWARRIVPLIPDTDYSGFRGVLGGIMVAAFGPATRVMVAETLEPAREQLRRCASWSGDDPLPAPSASAGALSFWNGLGRAAELDASLVRAAERVAAEREEARRTRRALSAAQESPRPDAGRGRPQEGEAAAR